MYVYNKISGLLFSSMLTSSLVDEPALMSGYKVFIGSVCSLPCMVAFLALTHQASRALSLALPLFFHAYVLRRSVPSRSTADDSDLLLVGQHHVKDSGDHNLRYASESTLRALEYHCAVPCENGSNQPTIESNRFETPNDHITFAAAPPFSINWQCPSSSLSARCSSASA